MEKILVLRRRYVFTKYLYLIIGIALVSMLVPKGLNILGVKLPALFDSVINDPDFVNIEKYLILFLQLFWALCFLTNFVLMFVFIKKSRSKVFLRLTNIFSLIIPIIYFMSFNFGFMGEVIAFIEADVFKYGMISIILSVIIFAVGLIFYFAGEINRSRDFKPLKSDFIKAILNIVFNILFLIGFAKIIDADYSLFQVIIIYFYLPFYAILIGIFEFVTGTKKFTSDNE